MVRNKIENTGYIRDSRNNGIFCNDISMKRKYETEMERANAEKARDAEINNLKSELSEIKQMLQQILSRG